jgi:hypothetical protein
VGLRSSLARVFANLALVAKVVGTIAATVLLVTCGGNEGTSDGPREPFTIFVASDETHVKPNESRLLVFTLRDALAQPVPGRVLKLSIVDAAKARGATLSIDGGLTGPTGEVAVQVIGGEPTEFVVRATAQAALTDREVRVRVTPQEIGPVAVMPEVRGVSAGSVALVRIAIFEDTRCATVPRGKPIATGVGRDTTLGSEVGFGAVSAVGGHAVFGQGLDAAGVLVAEGCVDLSGLSLLAEIPIHVTLPLTALDSSPVGQFSTVSQLRFLQDAPLPLHNLREAWRQLEACDLDPARLWLDCTVDALGPVTAADPLDCRPSATDEALFEGRLSARRGLPIASSPALYTCRQAVDGSGQPSLEKQIVAMFAGGQAQTVLGDLKAISAEGAKLLESFRLFSRIEVSSTSQPGRLQVDHHLTGFDVVVGTDPVPADLYKLGAAAPTARYVPAEATRSDLTIDRHGFTLRLGSLTRMAFFRGSLFRRGFPEDPTKFVSGVFGAASYTDAAATHKGCAALAALVCPLVGGAAGCLEAACEKGLLALGQSLDDAFSALDGEELDFFLQGSAPLLDRDGDGQADKIGFLPTSPGVWKASLRLKDEQFPIPGFFAGDRVDTRNQ